MPITTPGALPVLNYRDGVKAAFLKAYDSYQPTMQYPRLVTEIPSGKGRMSEVYAWLNAVQGMREWLPGEDRAVSGLVESSYTINNRKWEDTLMIERELFDNDQYGAIRVRIQDLAQAAATFKEKKIMKALLYAHTSTSSVWSVGLAHDGQFAADTDHKPNGVTTVNYATNALSASSLKDVISAMMAFTDDNGEIIGINPDTLVVGPNLQFIARELLNSQITVQQPGAASAGGVAATTASLGGSPYTNVLQGSLNLIVSPFFTDTSMTNSWAVLDCSRPLKPMILQQSDPLEVSQLGEGSDALFKTDTYQFGIRERWNVGWGIWQTMYLNVVA